MTKKDYELIAGVLRQEVKYEFNLTCQEVIISLVHNMAKHLEKANPRFDRDRFLKACGIE